MCCFSGPGLIHLGAQEPTFGGVGAARGGASGGGAATAAAITGSKEDPAAVERGGKLFVTNCGGCHGRRREAAPGAPDLIRSLLVLDDEKGILIAPVIRDGRPGQGMPKLEPDRGADCRHCRVAARADVRRGPPRTYAFLRTC